MAKQTPVNPHEPILSTEVHWRAPTEQDLTLDDHGRELLSPLPLEPPLGHIKQKTLAETMREMIRSEALKQVALAAGAETFDEANDFEIGDDYDPFSPWEEQYEPEELPGSPSPLPAPSTASPTPPATTPSSESPPEPAPLPKPSGGGQA